MRILPRPGLFVLLGIFASVDLQAKVEQVRQRADGVECQLTEGRLQVVFVTDRIARVRATKIPRCRSLR